MSEQQCYIVRQQSDLQNEEILKYVNVSILNIYFKKLDFIPVHIQILRINNCQLQSLKNLCNLVCLRYLDISFNLVNDISEILVHQNLEYLDFSSNSVIVINSVAQLRNLKTLHLANNKIINFEPLIHHENFDQAWLQPQFIPLKEDFTKMLTPGSTDEKVAQFMQNESLKREQSEYLFKMIKKLSVSVQNGFLTVENEPELTDFAFSDSFHIHSLTINQCINLKFLNAPKRIKHLKINNSQLCDINWVAQMTQLESIDLSGNNIVKCEPLSKLQLKAVNLSNNKIIDLKHIQEFIKFQNTIVSQQTKPNTEDFQKYLGQSGTEAQIQQLVAEMEENQLSNEQITHDTYNIQKYKDSVVDGILQINNDQNLTSIEFTELIGQKKVTELIIINCNNLKLDRCPKAKNSAVTKLTINCCGLNDLTGLQVMTQLTQLNLSLNKISNLSILASLVNLTSLDLGQNNIANISVLSNFKQLRALDLSENLLEDISSLRDLVQMEELDLSYGKLKSISDLVAMVNLKYLNISFNEICSIDSLAKMLNITYLNISRNKIISINVCEKFTKLFDLRTGDSFIQDFEPIAKLKYVNKNWIRKQNIPTENDFMNAFNCNSYEVKKLVEKNKKLKEISDIKFLLIKKYENKVQNNKLIINNETQLSNLQFTDVLHLQELEASGCKTINFDEDQIPKHLLKLKLNKCTFTNANAGINMITGIYQMEQLVELDLAFNFIRDITEIGNLTNLRKLFLQNNEISRIYAIGNLKQLNILQLQNNKIIFSAPLKELKVEPQLHLDNNLVIDNYLLKNQSKPQLIDYQNFLGPNSTDAMVKELEKTIDYNIHMFYKYNKTVQNSTLNIQNNNDLNDFGFTQKLNVQTLIIKDCKNVSLIRTFENLKTSDNALVNYPEVEIIKVPKQLVSLSIINSKLTNTTGLEQMIQLQKIELINNPVSSIKPILGLRNVISLTINGSKLTNIVGLEQMKQLQYLNLKDNCILVIMQIQALVNLNQVLIENNFIQDLEYLTQLPNYTFGWINQTQRVPTQTEFQNFINDTNSEMNVVQLQSQLAPTILKTDQLLNGKQDQDQRTKYYPQIKNKILTITGDSQIQDFKFVEQLDVVNLQLNNCANVKLNRTPSNILSLTINNTKLANLIGLEQMKQLQYIDIRDNCIVSIEPIKYLVNLKQILIDNNFIQDMEHVTVLPNYNSDWIYYQRVPTDLDIKNYLTDIHSNTSLQVFKIELALKKKKTDELIKLYPAKYDAEMIAKYQNQVQPQYPDGKSYGPFLRIQSDPNVRDLKFVESLNVTDLLLNGCNNAHLLRVPTNMQSLVHRDSDLKSVKGVERITELEYLDLQMNQLVNVNGIRELEKLTHLYINSNKITDLSPVEYLKGKGCCKNDCDTYNQKQPSQQEIDESRL
ncbi:Conserved_hypothetical protein [Hexamita inflata]|uniref:Uncharacterized protein n=1 Tax=Hexamita inflata TaxID=28002 RepID=A0AA86TUC9_9EUKA|nr:Conserved hypothetical protein [Hexamita inflata]